VNVPEAPRLSTADHIATVAAEGERFRLVVAQAPFDAPVPGCPGWSVERLVRHLGDVHRWAGTIVRERRTEPLHQDFDGPESSDDLVAWYGDGLDLLVRALSGTAPDDVFWAWAPAANPQAFWARRQAHETAIHRLDAEQACGFATPFGAVQAADGIDEWLIIAADRVKVAGGGGRTLHLSAVDVRWEALVELRDDGLRVRDPGAGGDCTVQGSASDLFALAMNRRNADGLVVRGDIDVLRAWRESVRF
jgi:uncharacterized protein (TIGR03083 family)